jgi:hypothetical protein
MGYACTDNKHVCDRLTDRLGLLGGWLGTRIIIIPLHHHQAPIPPNTPHTHTSPQNQPKTNTPDRTPNNKQNPNQQASPPAARGAGWCIDLPSTSSPPLPPSASTGGPSGKSCYVYICMYKRIYLYVCVCGWGDVLSKRRPTRPPAQPPTQPNNQTNHHPPTPPLSHLPPHTTFPKKTTTNKQPVPVSRRRGERARAGPPRLILRPRRVAVCRRARRARWAAHGGGSLGLFRVSE